MKPLLNRLRITEIFYSIQGESHTIGFPTVFIRLTGCPLRCQYCDTAYAFSGGELMSLETILSKVADYQPQYICVTGGEPLAQPGCYQFLRELCDRGYKVSIETSGARDIADIDKRVMIVMDLKTPASGESHQNRWANLDYLKPTDQIKFVICNREDYLWAKDMLHEYKLCERAQILFSPSWDQLAPKCLAEWILADRLQVRFQLQLHKILWNDEPGH